MSKIDSSELWMLDWLLTLASLVVGFAVGVAVFAIYNGWFNPWK